MVVGSLRTDNRSGKITEETTYFIRSLEPADLTSKQW